jgi:hypothetical protein
MVSRGGREIPGVQFGETQDLENPQFVFGWAEGQGSVNVRIIFLRHRLKSGRSGGWRFACHVE